MKKPLPLIALCFLLLVGCSKPSPSNNNNNQVSPSEDEQVTPVVDEQIYGVYKLYVSSGGTLTYEEWLQTVKGKDGASLLTGNGSPSNNLGNNGDSYIDLSSWDFYVKEESGWVKKGSIKGGENYDNLQELSFYPLPDGTYGVSSGNAYLLNEIIIPETYKGKSVSQIMSIGGQLTKLTIPSSIKKINSVSMSGNELTITYLGTEENFKKIEFVSNWIQTYNKNYHFKFSDKNTELTDYYDSLEVKIKGSIVTGSAITVNLTERSVSFLLTVSTDEFGGFRYDSSMSLNSFDITSSDTSVASIEKNWHAIVLKSFGTTKLTFQMFNVTREITLTVNKNLTNVTIQEAFDIIETLPQNQETEMYYTFTGIAVPLSGFLYIIDESINYDSWWSLGFVFDSKPTYSNSSKAIERGDVVKVTGRLVYSYTSENEWYKGMKNPTLEYIEPGDKSIFEPASFTHDVTLLYFSKHFTYYVWQWPTNGSGSYKAMTAENNYFYVDLDYENYLIVGFEPGVEITNPSVWVDTYYRSSDHTFSGDHDIYYCGESW